MTYAPISIATSATFKLLFPVKVLDFDTVPISSIFDHAMTGTYCQDTEEGTISYTNEHADKIENTAYVDFPCGRLYSYTRENNVPFIINSNYVGDNHGAAVLNYEGHPGYDFVVAYVDLVAAASGHVVKVDNDAEPGDDSGKDIRIKHAEGYETLYFHLSEIQVELGGIVIAGETVIGKSGASGADSPHLHFEVHKDSVPVDPYGWDPIDNPNSPDPYVRLRGVSNDLLWSTGGLNVSNEKNNSTSPSSYLLYQNFPNPFNPTTTIHFDVPKPSRVSLHVYDILGRHVANLVNGTFLAGSHMATFHAHALPSGAYIYRLETPNGTLTKTMFLQK